MAIAQVTIIPIGVGSSVGNHIAKIQAELEKSDLEFEINDMSTVIAGEFKQILEIVSRLHEIPFKNGAMRVITNISIDERRDKVVQLGDKLKSLTIRNQK